MSIKAAPSTSVIHSPLPLEAGFEIISRRPGYLEQLGWCVYTVGSEMIDTLDKDEEKLLFYK
jgi:hypothetical protein